MKEMSLRKLLVLLTLSAAACLAATTTVRGKLTQREGKPPAIEISGKLVILEGDEPTRGVLNDKRLATTVEWLSEGKRRNWKYENC